AWFNDRAQVHVKFYSLCFAALSPLLGSNILSVEPVNLVCYLAILVLTYLIARRFTDHRSALVSAAVVALWPSLLLHTTQVLRDPLFIAAFLTLVLVLVKLIADDYEWRKGLLAGLTGAFAALLLLMSRTDFWTVVRAMVLLSFVLFIVQALIKKKLPAGNLVGIVLLLVMTNFVLPLPRVVENQIGVSVGTQVRDAGSPYWARVDARRRKFVIEGDNRSGSLIDRDVTFANYSDLVKHVPRALAVGFFAPFPNMWFSAGYNVGRAGRLLAGLETAVTYAMFLLAAIFVWRHRRRVDIWVIVLTMLAGLTALGLVVINVGTLYRMRYSFWILLVILAIPVFTGFRNNTAKVS
ncbi:MAG TPA: glycosyltransferase family 39 protein, partial [Pyrinomonadaceae bacterium]|nr:glycosyltransferase family 39 protein [Pyrinomonadaceae bacterium]